MRCLIPVVLIIAAQLTVASRFDYLLRSPQYLLITQFKCGTTFEAGIPPNKCPRGVSPHNSPFSCDVDVRANLVLDPAGVHPPKVLYVGADQSRTLSIVIEDINTNLNGSHYLENRKIEFGKNTAAVKIDSYIGIHDVLGTIYDSDSQLLYILMKKWYKSDSQPSCLVFFVRNAFGGTGNVIIEKYSDFPLHSNNMARHEWTMDHSTQTAYYTHDHGEGIGLHAVPVTRLLSVLREGTNGQLIFSFQSPSESKRSHFRVSGRLLFTMTSESDIQFARMRNIHLQSDYGMNCQFRKNLSGYHDPHVISTIVISDNDFCLLRDGKGMDLEACKKERKDWRVEHKLQFESEKETDDSTWCTVLFVICLILAFLLVTSCLCVCWMKRNLDASFSEVRSSSVLDRSFQEPQRQVPYYSGRPGHYPEDISVDRWNSNY